LREAQQRTTDHILKVCKADQPKLRRKVAHHVIREATSA
jgi:hypothetical protein